MTWTLMAHGIVDAARREAVAEGIKAYIALYFEEYEDAEEIDADTWRTLDKMMTLGNTGVIDEELPELVNAVTAEITSLTGRRFIKLDDPNEDA